MLFDAKDRSSLGSKSRTEGEWEYLDRSGRPEAQRVRDLLNYWIVRYPDSERGELISRIVGGGEAHYQSATFELLLFAILKSMGCDVTIHPELTNGNQTHPDFLITCPDGQSAYVEAVLAADCWETKAPARKRSQVVLEEIGKIESPNFFLGIDAAGEPGTPPSSRALKRQITQWLESLNPERVIEIYRESGDEIFPKMDWNHDGWSLEFTAIPKKVEKRGTHQSVIGYEFGGARWSNAWEPIRDSIKKKGGRYGELPHPLIVAVNTSAASLDEEDEADALFGKATLEIQVGQSDAEPIPSRRNNGVWFGPKGVQYTRVSGAWIFHKLDPWNLASRRNSFYFNPWAVKTAPRIFTSINHSVVDENEIRRFELRKVGSILNLSPQWPSSE